MIGIGSSSCCRGRERRGRRGGMGRVGRQCLLLMSGTLLKLGGSWSNRLGGRCTEVDEVVINFFFFFFATIANLQHCDCTLGSYLVDTCWLVLKVFAFDTCSIMLTFLFERLGLLLMLSSESSIKNHHHNFFWNSSILV